MTDIADALAPLFHTDSKRYLRFSTYERGCVRATAVDTFQHGYRMVAPADAVKDRMEQTFSRSMESTIVS